MLTVQDINKLNVEKNYVPDGAETGTAGWATYADAAGVYPVDGTGGSPTVTWTTSATSPLKDFNSFLLTKDAANRQGEGVSYDFTIDSSDQGKILTLSFDYKIDSGTYADHDIYLTIYDVTNAVFIEPSAAYLKNATVNATHKATFQTAINSTSYRLVLHVSSTSASAYTLKFDNIKIAPQAIVNGAYISDWVSWTPTGTWVTNTTYTGKWRRYGDTLDAQVYITLSGAPTSTTLTLNLPSGMVLDTNKLPGSGNAIIFGEGRIRDAGTATYVCTVERNDTTSVNLRYLDASAITQAVNATAPITFANTDVVECKFRIPILGWGSNSTMSGVDSADGRIVAAGARRISSAQSLTTANSPLTIIFNSKRLDTHNTFDTSTGIYTVPFAGFYRVAWSANITCGATATDKVFGGISKNSDAANLGYCLIDDLIANGRYPLSGSAIVSCNAGDTLKLQLSTNTQTVTVDHASAEDQTCIYIDRLSSASSIAAGETVAAKYDSTSGQSIPNTGLNLVVYGNKIYDTHSAVVTNGTSTWGFYAPISGKYKIDSAIRFQGGAYVAGNIIYSQLYKNNVAQDQLDRELIQTSASYDVAIHAGASINLLAGDYIDIRVYNGRTAGATLLGTSALTSYICIERVGN